MAGGDHPPNDFVYDPKREASMNEDESDQFDDESSYSSSPHSNSTDDYPTQHAGLGDAADDAFADNLAKKLTRDVKVWRSIVSFMLLLTAILVTVSTYLFLTKEETRDFTDAVSDSPLLLQRFASLDTRHGLPRSIVGHFRLRDMFPS